jgi:hypothetical protein
MVWKRESSGSRRSEKNCLMKRKHFYSIELAAGGEWERRVAEAVKIDNGRFENNRRELGVGWKNL